MSKIKSHDCQMCGGPLEIDLDRQLYRCPFCGISYDYEYFREDNILDVAHTAITRGEFGAAKDAYEFMLKKDPHNFVALKGLILCKCKWRTIHPILHESKVHLKEDEATLLYAIDNCETGDKEYFTKIQEALSVLGRYRDTLKEIKKIEDERISENNLRNAITDAQMINNRRFTNSVDQLREAKTPKGDMSVFDMLFLLAVMAIAGFIIWLGWWVLIIVIAVIIASLIIYNVKKDISDKRLEEAKRPHTENIERLSNLCKEKREEAEKLRFQYGRLTKDIIYLDNHIHDQ